MIKQERLPKTGLEVAVESTGDLSGTNALLPGPAFSHWTLLLVNLAYQAIGVPGILCLWKEKPHLI